MKHLAIATILTAAFVGVTSTAASADPVFDRVESALSKGRRLDVTVEATLQGAGQILVSGTVNGQAVSLHKRGKVGHRTYKFALDAKKLRMRGLVGPLRFDVDVTASETGGSTVTQHVAAEIPLPCILLPGFGNENAPGGFAGFATALDLAAGGRYGTAGTAPSMTVHEYASLTESLATLGGDLGKTVKASLKGTVFGKVDLVGYSYGGLVARSYLSQAGGARVRNCIFAATPNEGAVIAYLAVGLSNSGQLAQLAGGNAQLQGIVDTLVTDQSKEALKNLYRTYSWATFVNPFTGQPGPAPAFVYEAFLGPSATPLSALNASPPAAGVTFHAFYYSSTGTGQLGTVDTLNLTDLQGALTGGTVDPTAFANGAGDGVAAAHSVTMEEVPLWKASITKHDLGIGTHVTLPADPNAAAAVAAILTQ
jgi:triacylglycerol esterase/lipase EstA (alpha/beta hydrolase family)